MNHTSLHARWAGPIVIIGFGSVGSGLLPLILRHVACDHAKITVISPDAMHRDIAADRGVEFRKLALTPDNYRSILSPLLTGDAPAFVVNVSVDVSSRDVALLCREFGALYIDTVSEPWAGFYTDARLSAAERSNYALREQMLSLRDAFAGGPTAVMTCGANPGMVSWLTKQALINLARDTGGAVNSAPRRREDWAQLALRLGVKGIHIAERDTQHSMIAKRAGRFVNTWSVEGFVAEAVQPAELGWGTHEKELPEDGRVHDFGCGAAIYLNRRGAATKVRTWTPQAGPMHGFLITHSESISIADYLTVREGGRVVYRPTCHYAYHPCDLAVISLHEMAGHEWRAPSDWTILSAEEISDGADELGVLLYGHKRNAYWYGSRLSIEETRRLAPYQNATGLQVTSAIIAGMVWAIENPEMGLVEADDLDFERCLEIQRPYLGSLVGEYTAWTPVEGRNTLFSERVDFDDPWQFGNVIVS
ncbi:saccharopine dehydrogenase NADP-binding domain-containing protein [Alsobacter sp. SYSU M60028]|uniref:Saccharopine dehydrogenase NADP-binding domain-containing protein n=1 Tax=Alsobacter ponti TaxID=2962936 RepID=A0ABT1LGY8_9HYPH|nr:saccharopine dehydrogenase C-terminal domain-containing protein [Alsobacter ponti]MCP8940771.1 saccharopine dehydrogenase NADP-binding domain-containing protein [Alsobacter ponti]